MKKVFVCSPYAGNIEENTKNARQYCKLEMMQGNAPFAPHLIYPSILDENKPEERELGIRMGLEFLKCCDELHVYGGVISSGMAREIAAWREMGNNEMHVSVVMTIIKKECI